MKKNIHNVGGFVAFSGESPKVINLITVDNLVEIAGEQREDAEEILGVGESA